MHYATEFGALYRLTDKRWQQFLEQRATGGTRSLESYGQFLGHVTNVTDLYGEPAQAELDAADEPAEVEP